MPGTTVNLSVIEPVALPANRTRPLHATLVENGVSDQLFDTRVNEVESTLPVFPVGLLPVSINRLSQLVIVTTI